MTQDRVSGWMLRDVEKPDIVLSRLAAGNHGLVTREQASAAGITRAQFEERVTKGPWLRIHKGTIRHAAVPASWEGGLAAACLAGTGPTVASHRSAAALYCLTGGSSGLVEVTTRRWKRGRYDGVVVHETKAMGRLDVTEVKGIPVTTAERTLLDLGAVVGSLTVQVALDTALKKRLTTRERIDQTLHRLARPRRAVTKLRTALERGRSEPSRKASRRRRSWHYWGHPGSRSRFPSSTDRGGGFVARVDAAYPEHRIALEYDSDQEHTGPAALARDNMRRNRLIAAGWTVIAARREDISRGGGEFVTAVGAALARRFASVAQE